MAQKKIKKETKAATKNKRYEAKPNKKTKQNKIPRQRTENNKPK